MNVTVDVENTCPEIKIPDATRFSHWINCAQRTVSEPLSGPLTVSIRILDEAESARLNSDYRGKNKPTNVLSFPASLPPVLAELLPERPLGDLAICAPVVLAEAEQQGKSPESHWAHLVIHGFLHLIGYDHESEQDAAVMEGIEVRLMHELGLPDPYSLSSPRSDQPANQSTNKSTNDSNAQEQSRRSVR